MNIIRGLLEHRNGNTNAKFLIDSYLYSFKGTISEGWSNFDQEVELSYKHIIHLKGRGKITGEIDAKSLSITLPNEVIISGAPPVAINGVSRILGKVSWLEL